MDPQEQSALCRFYREEFERHLDFLRNSGAIGGATRGRVDPACERFLDGLERVCGCTHFPTLAEALLRNLHLLSGLSDLESRRGH